MVDQVEHEPLAVLAVVGATGELEDAAPLEAHAIARFRVAEVGPSLVGFTSCKFADIVESP